MRILGLSTSATRGSVALVDGDRLVAWEAHATLHGHAERMLSLVERALAAAAWSRTSLDRVAVDVGPGSFTGVRVGISLGQGIGLGLDRPIVGVGSLESMARAARSSTGPTWALLDARREQAFAACYDADGAERVAPHLIALSDVRDACRDAAVVVGAIASTLGLPRAHRSPDADEPDARWIAVIGATRSPAVGVQAAYVRDADAVIPILARSRVE